MGFLSTRGYVISQYCKHKDHNEYYTTYEEVEYIFEHLTEDFTDKIIYSPFDGEESNFVKYIKSHKDTLKYKEFWYTSDDWYTHLDLFEKADYIISNPPFSELINHNGIKKEGILYKISGLNTKFLLFGGNLSIYYYKMILHKTDVKFYRRKYQYFINKEGELVSHSSVHYITNIENNFETQKLNLTKSYKELNTYLAKTTKGKEGLYVKYIKDIPYDYDGYLFVPITICFFDDDRIIYDIEDYRHKHIIINSPDGKIPYVKMRIKIKH